MCSTCEMGLTKSPTYVCQCDTTTSMDFIGGPTYFATKVVCVCRSYMSPHDTGKGESHIDILSL